MCRMPHPTKRNGRQQHRRHRHQPGITKITSERGIVPRWGCSTGVSRCTTPARSSCCSWWGVNGPYAQKDWMGGPGRSARQRRARMRCLAWHCMQMRRAERHPNHRPTMRQHSSPAWLATLAQPCRSPLALPHSTTVPLPHLRFAGGRICVREEPPLRQVALALQLLLPLGQSRGQFRAAVRQGHHTRLHPRLRGGWHAEQGKQECGQAGDSKPGQAGH